MLEKIGLPAKPSLRGSNWVVDASHCQGCSSQFTFINRKHHCRRCGGIFCNGCTHQRMYLRGQGDSPVRICDPCKKLEEAARFEMRHGNKIRAGRGSSKTTSKHEDEVLNQILGADGKQPFSSARESNSKVVGDFEGDTSNASTSNFDEESVTHDGNGSVHTQNDTVEEIGSSSPEELRQRALEEKQKYKILKGEGKPDEALRAFKRGKELEREAKALEIALKKSQRKAVSSSSVASIHKANDDHEESGRKRKVSSQMYKERKDDLAAELRELGWSETDLLDADKKPANISLEGELSSLIGEVHKKSGIGPRTGGINKAEVIALKKRALKFKREGNLAEAKEELKRAKVLEQKLEEQELLGEAEDSDDDLLALINSIDDDKQDDFSFSFEQDTGFNLDHLVGVSDDLGLDGGFDVTDADMYDPEIAAALTSLGWTEDSEHAEDSTGATALQPVSKDGKALLDEALSLKKEAVRQKKSGNVEAAMSLLRKAKLLEKDAENLHSQGNSSIVCNPSENMPASQMAEISSSVKVDDDMKHVNAKLPPKSKLAIQRELLGIKKKALALRREGRTDEAEEELRKGKVLEAQLEEMESTPKVRSTTVKVGSKVSEPVDLKEEVEDVDVTDQDMQDPALLSVLQNLGWKDEDEASKSFPSSDCATDSSALQSTFGIPVAAPRRTKAQIQRELLGLKRKALTLRRQGEDEEAEEILRQAKVLEEQIAEIEAPKRELMNSAKVEPEDTGSLGVQEAQRNMQETQSTESPLRSLVEKDATVGHMKAMDEVRTGESEIQMRSKDESPALSMDFGWIGSNSFITPPKITSIYDSKASQPVTLDFVAEEGVSDQASSFKHSSQSINLMDMVTGEDLQRSKLPIKIETNGNVSTNIQNGPFIQPATSKSSIKEIGSIGSISREQREKALGPTEKLPTHEASGPDSDSQNHSNIQQEILIRKRKAVALKREGKLAEAREELRQAKLLEKSQQQETVQPEASSIGVSHPTSNETPNVQEEQRVTHQAPKPMSGRDRFKLQQESLSHKRQALKLRREGRTEEAEAEFELAKALETQLEELSGQDSSNRSKSKNDDLGVEDLLDPQLLSALRSIGLDDTVTVPSVSDRSEVSKASFDKTPSISPEKSQPKVNPSETASQEKNELEERIKAEKVKAVTLKRAGKQTEALDALRRAKLYEKKLNSLA